MLTGIDHVILAVDSPDAAAAEVEKQLGLRSTGGGRHDAHGTHNRLIWLGDSYLELMGVFDDDLAARSWWGSYVRQLLADRGAGLAGVVLASDDLVADVAGLRAGGSSLGEPQPGQRSRPDGRLVRWQAALPERPDSDLGLAFLIEHDTSAAEWTPDERSARATEIHPMGTAARLLRMEVPVSDVRAAQMRIHRGLGVAFRPSLSGGGARDGSIGRQVLRLLRVGSRPLIAIGGGRAERELELLGCRWLIAP
ncbi:MAG TPA: VOC family protein [Candidatus Limnocylindrales bacterium]|jgi:hypothetical protein|nr:VOC family protein [Candidatus Limnocylindrales bacterium]